MERLDNGWRRSGGAGTGLKIATRSDFAVFPRCHLAILHCRYRSPPPAELLALSRQLCTRIVNAIERDGPLPFDTLHGDGVVRARPGLLRNGLHKFGPAGDFVTAA